MNREDKREHSYLMHFNEEVFNKMKMIAEQQKRSVASYIKLAVLEKLAADKVTQK